MKKALKDYFTFSRKERVAVIILLLVITVCMVLPQLYHPRKEMPLPDAALTAFLSRPAMETASKLVNTYPDIPESHSGKLFSFDPNTLSAEGWKALGLPTKTVRTIGNYLSKGGRFRRAEDIRKIWGIAPSLANRLLPYVQIAETEKPAYNHPRPVSSKPRPVQMIIDINTAGVEEWKALPGIGEVLAGRILKYRDKLGGFTDMEQLRKTYGISDSVFQKIAPLLKTDPATIPRLDLNTASFYELKAKLFLTESMARSFLVYRKQNGLFQSVSDLKKMVFLPDSLFQRILPYVKVN